MNRIEKRLVGTDAGIPGSGVCYPGDNRQNKGMLGAGSFLYSKINRTRTRNVNTAANQRRNIEQFKKKINNSKKNNEVITRIENKLENIEKSNALNIVGIHQKLNVQETDIQFIKGDFKKQLNTLKDYIKVLEEKIDKLTNREVLIGRKVNVDENLENEVRKEVNDIKKIKESEKNVTLEIVEP